MYFEVLLTSEPTYITVVFTDHAGETQLQVTYPIVPNLLLIAEFPSSSTQLWMANGTVTNTVSAATQQ